jgi:hypothetical protein
MSVTVQTKFEGGNARVVALTAAEDMLEVHLAADPAGGTNPLWFHARLVESTPSTGVEPNRIRIVLRFLENASVEAAGGFDPTSIRPVARWDGQDWVRMRPGRLLIEVDGQRSVAWELEAPNPTLEIALSFPYLKEDLNAVFRKSRGFWQSFPIGISRQGRLLERWTGGGDASRPAGSLPGIYLISRWRGGDSTGAWVLEGMLQDFARDRHPGIGVYVVPIADPDGTFRSTSFRTDLTHGPLEQALRADLIRWQQRYQPKLLLDLAGGDASDAAGCLLRPLTSGGDGHWPPTSEKWANVLRTALSDSYGAPECILPPRRSECEEWAGLVTEEFPALRLVIPHGVVGEKVLSRKNYREIGQKIAKAILQRLRH